MNKPVRSYASMPISDTKRTWAEIDLGALKSNYRYLKSTLGNQSSAPRIIAVVKADAYGHGADACAQALIEEGCDLFAVSCLEEALALRATCRACKSSAEILIFGYTNPTLARTLAENSLLQALLSEQYAIQLNAEAEAAGVIVRTHIAVDTGMNRIGFGAYNGESIEDTAASIERVCSLHGLSVDGIFSHFARADEEPGGEGERRTDEQSNRFRSICRSLQARGVQIPLRHLCNSAAALRRTDDHLDAVRLGITLYGARPSEIFSLPLRPVMRLCTVIAQIHRLERGEGVSYGGRFEAEEEKQIATLPIGYADGLSRAYEGARVTVRTKDGDKTAPIVGRICMDQCMIDVTGISAEEGDGVVIFGNDPQELCDLAKRSQTIEYEVLCRVSARVPRVFVE